MSSVAASSHCRSSRKSASGCSGRAKTPRNRRNTSWRRPCACCGESSWTGESPSREVGELQDFLHLAVVDLVGGVGGLVIVRMEAGEPPNGRDAPQGERELVAAEEDIERGFL